MVYSFKKNVKLISKDAKINTKDNTKSLETLHKSDIDNIMTTKRRFNSNTEPIIRVYSEAKSQESADELSARFIKEIKNFS